MDWSVVIPSRGLRLLESYDSADVVYAVDSGCNPLARIEVIRISYTEYGVFAIIIVVIPSRGLRLLESTAVSASPADYSVVIPSRGLRLLESTMQANERRM